MFGRDAIFLPFGEELKTHTYKIGQDFMEIGQIMILPDGRVFRFANVGGTNSVAGTLQQSAVPVSNHIGQTSASGDTGAVGANQLLLTVGATAVDAGQYDNGIVVFESGGTGKGYYYALPSLKSDFTKALGNYAASAQLTVNLQTGVTVQKALQAGTDVFSLIENPYRNFVINATAQTAPCAGAALVVATTHGTIDATGGNATGVQMGDSCWLQVAGPCVVRQDASSVVAGQPVTTSPTTAGDVALATTATPATNPFVGQCIRVAASGAWSTVNLQIDTL